MKYWEGKGTHVGSYSRAKKEMIGCRGGAVCTRPEWNGIHLVSPKTNEYVILLKDGTIITNPTEIFDTDKNDWIMVVMTDEAVRLLLSHNLV